MDKPVAVVTGGNRGIGFETCRQLARRGFHVILGSRDPAKGQRAADELRANGADVVALSLDVADPASIATLREELQVQVGRVDVLVNNAGIIGSHYMQSILRVSDPEILTAFEVNFLGPLHMCQAIVPLMQDRGHGRIVNVSSGMGQLHDMGSGAPPYRVSKASINVLTRVLARELESTDILVNSVCPGWVRTALGGQEAPRSLEEGAQGIVWAATLPEGGPTGGFFRDGEPIPW